MRESPTTIFFYSALFFLALFLGYHFGERQGLLVGFLFVLLVIAYAFYFHEASILRLFNCYAIEGQDPWGLSAEIKNLAVKLRIARPQLLIIKEMTATALTLSRGQGRTSILISEGLIQYLNQGEQKTLMALLMCHLAHQKTFLKVTGATFAFLLSAPFQFLDNIISLLFKSRIHDFHFFQSLIDPVVILIQRTFSGKRLVLNADRTAATIIDNSEVVAQLLWKLDSISSTNPLKINLTDAHLFLVNPLAWKERKNLLQRQLPIEVRIKSLIGRYPI